MALLSADRYRHRPLVRLLECYVLWTIGQLSDREMAALETMTPKLQEVYQKAGTWQQVISTVMHFPDGMPAAIMETWRANVAQFDAHNTRTDPEEFAQRFVDENFSSI